jgi:hypothetical protein
VKLNKVPTRERPTEDEKKEQKKDKTLRKWNISPVLVPSSTFCNKLHIDLVATPRSFAATATRQN